MPTAAVVTATSAFGAISVRELRVAIAAAASRRVLRIEAIIDCHIRWD